MKAGLRHEEGVRRSKEKRRTTRRMHRVGSRWGERSHTGSFAGSTGHCLLLKAGLGYCFHTRRVEIISEKPLSGQEDSEPSNTKLQGAGAKAAG